MVTGSLGLNTKTLLCCSLFLASLVIIIRLAMKSDKMLEIQGNKDTKGNQCLRVRQLLFGKDFSVWHNITRVLLVTQMRSGSSFVAHLLTQSSVTFYTEEPAREFLGQDSVTTRDQVKGILELLRDILLCNFSTRPHYFAKRISGMHFHNRDNIKLCLDSNSLCWDPATDTALCQAAKMHLVRLVAVDLGDLLSLLGEGDLNLKIIHLVRDPRGVLASRLQLRKVASFLGEELTNISTICKRYNRDLNDSLTIVRDYPSRYTLLRYEDMARRTELKVRQMHQFLSMPYTAVVAKQVANHALGLLQEHSHPYSLQKNASATAFKWRQVMPFHQIKTVQDKCSRVLRAYGYRIFNSESDLWDDGVESFVSPQPEFRHLDRYANEGRAK